MSAVAELVARLLATSSLAGTRGGLTLLALAIAARMGVMEAPQEWMVSNIGLGILLAVVVIEELAEQDEDLQALVDLCAYALRGGAGALAAGSIQATAASAGVEGLPAWAAALAGATIAVATHHLRARLHEQLEGIGEGLLSPRTWLAWLELGGVIGLMVAVVLAPAIALGFVILASALSLLALGLRRAAEDKLRRRGCEGCTHRARVEASRCPSCKRPLEVARWLQ